MLDLTNRGYPGENEWQLWCQCHNKSGLTCSYSTQTNEATWGKTCLWLCLRSKSNTSVHQHTDVVYILFLFSVILAKLCQIPIIYNGKCKQGTS